MHDNIRAGAYTRNVPLGETQRTKLAAAARLPPSRRRRPPSWQEQKKREAWGQFWGQVNKGAMQR